MVIKRARRAERARVRFVTAKGGLLHTISATVGHTRGLSQHLRKDDCVERPSERPEPTGCDGCADEPTTSKRPECGCSGSAQSARHELLRLRQPEPPLGRAAAIRTFFAGQRSSSRRRSRKSSRSSDGSRCSDDSRSGSGGGSRVGGSSRSGSSSRNPPPRRPALCRHTCLTDAYLIGAALQQVASVYSRRLSNSRRRRKEAGRTQIASRSPSSYAERSSMSSLTHSSSRSGGPAAASSSSRGRSGGSGRSPGAVVAVASSWSPRTEPPHPGPIGTGAPPALR